MPCGKVLAAKQAMPSGAFCFAGNGHDAMPGAFMDGSHGPRQPPMRVSAVTCHGDPVRIVLLDRSGKQARGVPVIADSEMCEIDRTRGREFQIVLDDRLLD